MNVDERQCGAAESRLVLLIQKYQRQLNMWYFIREILVERHELGGTLFRGAGRCVDRKRPPQLERDGAYRGFVFVKTIFIGGTEVYVKITFDKEKICCSERRLCGHCGKKG